MELALPESDVRSPSQYRRSLRTSFLSDFGVVLFGFAKKPLDSYGGAANGFVLEDRLSPREIAIFVEIGAIQNG